MQGSFKTHGRSRAPWGVQRGRLGAVLENPGVGYAALPHATWVCLSGRAIGRQRGLWFGDLGRQDPHCNPAPERCRGQFLSAAFTSFILTRSQYSMMREILFWLMGGLEASSWDHVRLTTPVVFLGVTIILLFTVIWIFYYAANSVPSPSGSMPNGAGWSC